MICIIGKQITVRGCIFILTVTSRCVALQSGGYSCRAGSIMTGACRWDLRMASMGADDARGVSGTQDAGKTAGVRM